MAIPQNFNCVEQQIINATTASSSAQFTNKLSASQVDILLVNEGPNGCQVVLGAGTSAPTAVASASANGTAQIRVSAGAILTIKKNAASYVAAICDTGTATLYCHAGQGS